MEGEVRDRWVGELGTPPGVPCAQAPVPDASLEAAVLRVSAHGGGGGGVGAKAGGAPPGSGSVVPPRPLPHRARCGWGPVLTLGAGRREAGAQEVPAGFSLLGELEDEEDEDDEKLTPVRPGGLVAVFCPVRLFRHTGQLSCCCSQGTMQPSWKR